jgi:hypothetical protein
MIPKELLEDYFIDQEDGLKKLLTWFLNLVMLNLMSALTPEKLIETATKIARSKRD